MAFYCETLHIDLKVLKLTKEPLSVFSAQAGLSILGLLTFLYLNKWASNGLYTRGTSLLDESFSFTSLWHKLAYLCINEF